MRIQKRLGTSFVHVTHDQEEAMSIADRVVVMNYGRVEDQGTPDRASTEPATLFTATFMGESNILEGTVRRRDGAGLIVDTALGEIALSATTPHPDPPQQASGVEQVSLSIRPEHLGLGPAPAGSIALPPVAIEEIVFQGTHLRLHAHSDTGVGLLLRVPAVTPVEPGMRTPLYADPGRIVLLRS